MCINIRITHETINIGSGISVTDTNLRIIGYKLLGTEGNTVRIGIETFCFGSIVQFGFVEQTLNPHCTAFEDIVAGSHTFATG